MIKLKETDASDSAKPYTETHIRTNNIRTKNKMFRRLAKAIS